MTAKVVPKKLFIDRGVEKKLNRCLQDKIVNNQWIYPLIYESNKANVEAFPYRPDIMSHTLFDQYIYTSTTKQPTTFPKVETDSETPKYTILIPAKGSNDKSQVANILNIFKDQSYGMTAEESQAWVRSNLAAVIALNRPKSLEDKVNKEFLDQIENTKKVDGIAYRVFGFFWKFDWITKSDAEARIEAKKAKGKKVKVQKIEDQKVKKTYLLLRYLNADAAKEVRERFEGNDDSLSDELKQIMNIQKIRQRLLTEPHAQEFLDHFAKKTPNSPRYLCSQDADVKAIRCQQDQEGLFKHYDDLIGLYFKCKKQLPSFASTGYAASLVETELIRVAVEIDMAIRKAMTIFFTTYFPEPNFIWLVKDKIQASWFSFIGKEKADHKLEALRLMQNAFRDELLDPNHTTFGMCGAITTTIPERMKTQENKKNVFNVAEKPTLQGLRSRKAQLHSFPRVWANQLYPFLSISASTTTNITTPLMSLYSVFHLISLIFAWEAQLLVRYKSEYFYKIMGFYRDYVKCMKAIYNDPTNRNQLIQNFCNIHGKDKNDKKQLETFLNFQIDMMFKAKASLKKIYDATPSSDPSELDKIVRTAIDSGNAIYLKFRKYS